MVDGCLVLHWIAPTLCFFYIGWSELAACVRIITQPIKALLWSSSNYTSATDDAVAYLTLSASLLRATWAQPATSLWCGDWPASARNHTNLHFPYKLLFSTSFPKLYCTFAFYENKNNQLKLFQIIIKNHDFNNLIFLEMYTMFWERDSTLDCILDHIQSKSLCLDLGVV